MRAFHHSFPRSGGAREKTAARCRAGSSTSNGMGRWYDAPALCGSCKILHNQFARRSRMGGFARMFQELAQPVGQAITLMIDSTLVHEGAPHGRPACEKGEGCSNLVCLGEVRVADPVAWIPDIDRIFRRQLGFGDVIPWPGFCLRIRFHAATSVLVRDVSLQSAFAKCAIWSEWAFLKAGRSVIRVT